jgi:L-threonylcarbamoyladenylate synthase
VVAIPTDTVYGLAGDPFRPGVVERIFRLKQRAENQPILLLIDSLDRLRGLVRDVPRGFRTIANRFWPGPLTVILAAAESVPRSVTAGTGTVAVRWPASPFVRALIREAGAPLTGTSANLSGRPAAVTAEEATRQVGGGVYYVVDGGRSPSRLPSTLLDLTGKPRIVRNGAVPAARLKTYL